MASSKGSELSRQKTAIRASNADNLTHLHQKTKTGNGLISQKVVSADKPTVSAPTKAKLLTGAPTKAPTARLQELSQPQLGVRPVPQTLLDTGVSSTRSCAKGKEHAAAELPVPEAPAKRPLSPQANAVLRPRSRSRSRPPPMSGYPVTAVQESAKDQVVQVTSTRHASPVRQQRLPSGVAHTVLTSPSPREMHLDPAPVKHALPIRSRSSTSSTATLVVPSVVAPNPAATAAAAVPEPGYRVLKPILKRRALEMSPAKTGPAERAKKRQKLSEVPTGRDRGQDKPSTLLGERRTMAGDNGRVAVLRRGKVELAPRKQVTRFHSRVDAEGSALAPMVLPNVDVGSSSLPGHSFVHGPDVGNNPRSYSQLEHQSVHNGESTMHYPATQGLSEGIEEDVFGTILENSLEAAAATRATPKYHPPSPNFILESVSPIQQAEKRPSVPQGYRAAGEHQLAYQRNHVLQPSTAHNSPKRTRPPVTQKAVSPARVDYRPKLVENFAESAHFTRDLDNKRGDAVCRLTIPVSPKFMRIHREKRQEEQRAEREHGHERPVKPMLPYKEPSTRVKEQPLPPVSSATSHPSCPPCSPCLGRRSTACQARWFRS